MSSAAIPKTTNRWVLAEHVPKDRPLTKDFFRWETDVTLREIQDGELLVKVAHLGMEPSMKGTFTQEKSYRPAHPLGAPLWALGIADVLASKSSKYSAGDRIFGYVGQESNAIINENSPLLQKLHPALGKQALSLLGPPGLAAHVGLMNVAKCTKDDVVLVSAAAGATGSIVVQLAKALGVKKVVGIASSRKLDAVLETGADAAVGYDSPSFLEDLRKATNEEVSVYFENVGGKVLDAALEVMAPNGRIALCGVISEYQGQEEPIRGMRWILKKKLLLEGFICNQRGPEALLTAIKELTQWGIEGKVKTNIHTYQKKGLEHAPDALLALLNGENTGKMVLDL
ncbi:NAD(P)-binding protein [Ceraceosorus guamensis]|uniref:NAD(P)-binding protein n=1 Tax=Ceraceosorus guamensis TaxID=1522189 RepID=A0A316VY85_9BASI|nr:NAD(P)-binding protein [Ceraceosorus guamensis]PWN41353.1 NAD(P)-binding protein [Ceraceosorus guamensis]